MNCFQEDEAARSAGNFLGTTATELPLQIWDSDHLCLDTAVTHLGNATGCNLDNITGMPPGMGVFRREPLSIYGGSVQSQVQDGKSYCDITKLVAIHGAKQLCSLGQWSTVEGWYQTAITGDCDYAIHGSFESLLYTGGAKYFERKTGCDIPLNRKTAGRCRDFLSRLHNDEHGAIQIPLTRRGRRGGLAMQSLLLRFREDSLFRRHRMGYTMRLSLLMAEFFRSSLIRTPPEFGVRNPMHQGR